MGRELRGTGMASPLQDTSSEHFVSPNASRPMFQNPREMGQFGTRRFRGYVPRTPGNGTHWNMAADEGRMEQWEGPLEETARAEDALVLGLVGAGILRSQPGDYSIDARDRKNRMSRHRRGVRRRLEATVDMQFEQSAVGVRVRRGRSPRAIRGAASASFTLHPGRFPCQGAVQGSGA